MITIAGLQLTANDVVAALSTSVLVESYPWLTRDVALNSRSSTGHKSIEVEVLSGVRVLMQAQVGQYTVVPRNNDPIANNTDRTFTTITASISVTGIDNTGLNALAAAEYASMQYYVNRKLLLGKINDSSLSYDYRKARLAELDLLSGSGLVVSIPAILDTYIWEFVESKGLNISYWTNGPYADVKITVVGKKQIIF